MSNGSESLGDRRPFWQEVALTGVFAVVLFAFGWAVAYVGDAIADSAQGAYTFTTLIFLLVIAFLVWHAYPPRRRRWYHFAIFELCVLVPYAVLAPLVYLPWLIVTRREWRRAG